MITSFGVLLMFWSSLNSGLAMEKFRCTFKNNDYQLDPSKYKNNDPSLPVFGEDPIPLEFRSKEEFNTFLKEVTEINKKVIENTVLNTFDNFLAFYDAWEATINEKKLDPKTDKPEAEKLFVQFYKSYNAKFYPNSMVGLVIKMADTLISELSKKWTNIKSYVYLSAQQSHVHMPEIQLKDIINKHVNARSGEIIDGVVVNVKFSLENSTGHIIFDPINGFMDPLVVMIEGDCPTENEIYKSTIRDENVYTIFKYDNRFIKARDQDEPYESSKAEFLIYSGFSYCSIMDITERIDLLSFDRALIKRNALGKDVCQVGVTLDSIINSDREAECLASPFIEVSIRKNKIHDIQYSFNIDQILNDSDKLSSVEEEVIKEASHGLGLDSDSLHKEMKRIAKMMKNDFFVHCLQFVPYKNPGETLDRN